MASKTRRPITMKEIKEWIELNNQGYRTTEIGKLYGRSQQIVARKLHEFGVKLACPKNAKGTFRNRYYKRKYIINVYNLSDQLCWQFNNPHEMAKTFKKSIKSCKDMLCAKNINRLHTLEWCGRQRYRIYLQEVEDE